MLAKVIRSVTIHNLNELQQLARTTFYDTFAEMNTAENMEQYLSTDLSEEKLRTELLNPDSKTFFIQTDGETIGYMKLNVRSAQTEQFDPGGDYIRAYVDELAECHGVAIHQPGAGGFPGYLAPMVDHSVEREVSLARYKAVSGK